MLSYQELLQVAQKPQITSTLKKKIQVLLSQPFIYRNTNTSQPVLVTHPNTGPSLRVAAWNIERGFHAREIADLLSAKADKSMQTPLAMPLDIDAATAKQTTKKSKSNDSTLQPSGWSAKEGEEERDWLSKSQVLFLTEVDNGVGRTQYRDITRMLAKRLHMNAVYGVEFLELGPLSKRMQQYAADHGGHIRVEGIDFSIKPAKYRGLHGSAILSRYPILDAQIIRLPQCYDWFKNEKAKLSKLETVKRSLADKIFQEAMLTEVREGGRMALAVDLAIPSLPEKKATFVVVHLENRCQSDCRQKQMAFLLNALKDRRNPIVFGGDFNTSGTDASPTSIKKEVRERLKDPSFWTRSMISLLVPFGYIANASIVVSKYTKNFHNPATPSVPLILPNTEYQVFQTLKAFQFQDGHVLDLRGDDAHAYQQRGGLMANSNQRALKGFVPTFSFERPLLKGFLGTYKLDWFLVKDYLTNASAEKETAPRQFAPCYARTLREINKTYRTPLMKTGKKGTYSRLSDHDPITIDLPLQEPTLKKPAETDNEKTI